MCDGDAIDAAAGAEVLVHRSRVAALLARPLLHALPDMQGQRPIDFGDARPLVLHSGRRLRTRVVFGRSAPREWRRDRCCRWGHFEEIRKWNVLCVCVCAHTLGQSLHSIFFFFPKNFFQKKKIRKKHFEHTQKKPAKKTHTQAVVDSHTRTHHRRKTMVRFYAPAARRHQTKTTLSKSRRDILNKARDDAKEWWRKQVSEAPKTQPSAPSPSTTSSRSFRLRRAPGQGGCRRLSSCSA